MSRCGKKGGIPKKFHNAYKKNYSSERDGNYLTWIAGKWKRQSDEAKKDYMKGKGNTKNGVCKVKKTTKKKRSKPKTLPSDAWIKKWSDGSEAKMKAWKEWRTKNKRPSKIAVGKYLVDQGFSRDALDCFELRSRKLNCVKGKYDSMGTRLSKIDLMKQAYAKPKVQEAKGPIAALAQSAQQVFAPAPPPAEPLG